MFIQAALFLRLPAFKVLDHAVEFKGMVNNCINLSQYIYRWYYVAILLAEIAFAIYQ